MAAVKLSFLVRLFRSYRVDNVYFCLWFVVYFLPFKSFLRHHCFSHIFTLLLFFFLFCYMYFYFTPPFSNVYCSFLITVCFLSLSHFFYRIRSSLTSSYWVLFSLLSSFLILFYLTFYCFTFLLCSLDFFPLLGLLLISYIVIVFRICIPFFLFHFSLLDFPRWPVQITKFFSM